MSSSWRDLLTRGALVGACDELRTRRSRGIGSRRLLSVGSKESRWNCGGAKNAIAHVPASSEDTFKTRSLFGRFEGGDRWFAQQRETDVIPPVDQALTCHGIDLEMSLESGFRHFHALSIDVDHDESRRIFLDEGRQPSTSRARPDPVGPTQRRPRCRMLSTPEEGDDDARILVHQAPDRRFRREIRAKRGPRSRRSRPKSGRLRTKWGRRATL